MEPVHAVRADAQRYLKLLPLPEVRRRMGEALSNVHPLAEEVPVDRAVGRICAEEVKFSCDIPSRSIAAMDG